MEKYLIGDFSNTENSDAGARKFFCYPHAIDDKENNCILVAYENYTQHYLAKIDYSEL
ncbi:MAG: hypothetical protein IJN65_02855 [Clostridia bacterium]|nr:hypothetical protein [Clostridia bacterium]